MTVQTIDFSYRLLTNNNWNVELSLFDLTADDVRISKTSQRRVISRHHTVGESVSMLMTTMNSVVSDNGTQPDEKFQNTFVEGKLASLYVCLSLDYLMTVQDIFMSGIASYKPPETDTPRATPDQPDSGGVQETERDEKNQMHVNFTVNHPEVILLEDMDNPSSNCLVLEADARVQYQSTGNDGNLRIVMKKLCLYCSSLVDFELNSEANDETKYRILEPIDIVIDGALRENKQRFTADLSCILLSMAPVAIRTAIGVTKSLGTTDSQEANVLDDSDYAHIWEATDVKSRNLWFLTETPRYNNAIQTGSKQLVQEMTLSCPGIYFKVEMGEGQVTLPVLASEFTDFWFRASNWSDQLLLDGHFNIEVAAFNEHAGGWEPIVERIENQGSMTSVLTPCILQVSPHDRLEISGRERSSTKFVSFPEGIEITLTASSLRLLYQIYQSFSDAYSAIPKGSAQELTDPMMFENLLGEDIKFRGLTDIEMKFSTNEAVIAANQKVPLFSRASSSSRHSIIRPNAANDRQEILVTVRNVPVKINITRSLPRIFKIDCKGRVLDLLCETKCVAEKRTVRVRGLLKIENRSPLEVSLLKHLGDSKFHHVATIGAGDKYFPSLQLLTDDGGRLYFLDNNTAAQAYIDWKVESSKVLCFEGGRGNISSYLRAQILQTPAFKGNSDQPDMKMYSLYLNACLTISNLLPISLFIQAPHGEWLETKSGENLPLINRRLPCQLNFRFYGLKREMWNGTLQLAKLLKTTLVMTFRTTGRTASSSMFLAIHIELVNDAGILQVFCPYWILNKTTTTLHFRMSGSNDVSVIDPSNESTPYMMRCKEIDKSQRKACIKILDGDWSERFSLDAIGNTSSLICKRANNLLFEIGLSITVSACGLTRIVEFTPFYTILNRLTTAIEVREYNPRGQAYQEDWIKIDPDKVVAFWPSRPNKQQSYIRCRHFGGTATSALFPYDREHSSLLRISDPERPAVKVDCLVSQMSSSVLFSDYSPGSAPLLIVNCGRIKLELFQTGYESYNLIVLPKQSVFFTWPVPIGEQSFDWRYGAFTMSGTTLQEQAGEFIPFGESHHFWAIFIEAGQRVMLITEDQALIKRCLKTFQGDKLSGSIQISCPYLGVSLVDDIHRQEIVYLSMVSSTPTWYENRSDKTKRPNPSSLRPLHDPLAKELEQSYQRVYGEMRKKPALQAFPIADVGKSQKLDINLMRLYDATGKYRNLVRNKYDAFWMRYAWTENDVFCHIRIFKLQIDNQLETAIFPVVLRSVIPKNALSAEIDRPMIEVSAIKSSAKEVVHIKHLHVLVQEFAVELDQSLIGSLLGFFSIETEIKGHACMATDIKYCQRSLSDILTGLADTRGSEIIMSACHISPLKLHFSFSMHTSKSESAEELLRKYPAVDFFLQTFNIAEVQDCVLQLGYYHRVNCRTTQARLLVSILNHYRSQLMKQIYVIMFGLDALGNPFGMLRGVGEGIESLFYEPYKGLVEGPQEFAEGLFLGVRNLFGGVIGGASGVASKITGTVGKGLAQLTFDDAYKSKRLKTRAQEQTVPQTLARGGHGVWMGFYEGVTGVVTKPLEGVKTEGAEGFMKGLGKGMIGLVTRPIGGVVDLASASFEGVKKLSTQENVVKRVRLPRFIDYDYLSRPYRYYEAAGNELLQQLDDPMLNQKVDIYAAHILCTANPNSWLLATNRRMMMILEVKIFNQKEIHWMHSYDDMTDYPAVRKDEKDGKDYVFIALKEYTESNRLFRPTKGYGRQVVFRDRAHAEWLCSKVKGLMQDQGLEFDSNRKRPAPLVHKQ